MPDLITHYLFAKECLPKLSKKASIEKYRANYDLGCNGPDYFFYYHILPWPKDKDKEKIHQYGNDFHNRHINEFFEFAFRYLKQHQDDAFYAYFVGYLMHYFLDRKAHPYIFYFSGVQDNREQTKIYKYYHKRFEVCIDERMLIERQQQSIKQFHPASMIDTKNITMEIVYDFVSRSLDKVYQQSLSKKQFVSCIKDFHLNLKLLYSKRKWKKKIVLWVENKFHLNPFISTAMYSIEKEDIDYLNLNKQIWLDPCDKACRSNKSFIELYEEAKEEAIAFIQLLDDYLVDKVGIDDLMKMIDGRCFDTNHQEFVQMKYSDCVYEKNGGNRDGIN